jgi:starch-binding outer membrane protein SusE/F
MNLSDQLDMPFRIYPNPASDKLFIHSANKTINRIQIADFAGKVVFTSNQASQNKTIDLTGITRGLYLIRVQTTDNVYTSKIRIK